LRRYGNPQIFCQFPSDTFFDEVKELHVKLLKIYDFLVTLVGDTITEEALPTYESWLMDVEGIDNVQSGMV
jgi:acyl-[acyl-carrier-protein] desaturase